MIKVRGEHNLLEGYQLPLTFTFQVLQILNLIDYCTKFTSARLVSVVILS